MKICFKCNGSGKILIKQDSLYTGSFDYYPHPCPHCEKDNFSSQKSNFQEKKDITFDF